MQLFGLNHRLWCFFSSYGDDFPWSPTTGPAMQCMQYIVKVYHYPFSSPLWPGKSIWWLKIDRDVNLFYSVLKKFEACRLALKWLFPPKIGWLISQSINMLHGCYCWLTWASYALVFFLLDLHLLESINRQFLLVPSNPGSQPRLNFPGEVALTPSPSHLWEPVVQVSRRQIDFQR